MGYQQLPITPYRPPEPDLLGDVAKVLTLRNLGQQNQENQIKLQQMRQAQQDQVAMTQAIQQWDGQSYDSLIKAMVKRGASGPSVMKVQSGLLEQREKYSKIAEQDATTGSKNLETMQKRFDLTRGAINTVLDQPDETLPTALTQTAASLAQQGILDPPHVQQAQQIAQLAQTNPQAAREQLKAYNKSMTAESQQIAFAKEKAQTAAYGGAAALGMMKLGMKPDPNNPGGYVRMNPEEYPPALASTIEKNDAIEEWHSAQAEFQRAKAAGEPQRVQQAAQRLNVAKQNYQLKEAAFQRDTFGEINGQPVPGGAVDSSGAPIGSTSPAARSQAQAQRDQAAAQRQQTGIAARPPAKGNLRFRDSNGDLHDIPAENFSKAKRRDPGAVIVIPAR